MIDLTVKTDLEDYAPGSTAVITASGLRAGSTIKLEVDHTLGAGADGIWGTHDDVIATSSGAGHESWFLTDGGVGDLDGLANLDTADSLGARFLLSAATAAADGLLGTSDDAVATAALTAAAALTLTGASVTHDESAGLQNGIPSTATEDNNDNDIAVGSLPSGFATRLGPAGLNAGTPTGAAVSGYTGGAGSGSNAFTIDPAAGAVTDVRFVDAAGAPLNGLASGKFTLSGTEVLLYTDTGDNNILLGRAGAGGPLVFAAYIEQTGSPSITGGKVWIAQYQALKHPGAGNPDDAVDLSGLVHVGVSQDKPFDLSGAPSGQNLFLMFTTASPTITDVGGVDRISEVAIVATGKDPATGDTLNTSQAGGPTTFGTNSQMITEQEGVRFTFVTGARQGVVIPNLTSGEAGIEANIDFTAFFGARTATFDVVQLQSGKSAQVKISAFNSVFLNEVGNPNLDEAGVGFIDGYSDDALVVIQSVTVTNAGGAATPIVVISGGIATITGVEAGDKISYTTTADHNRVLVENGADLNAKGQTHADFDIGGFKLLQVSNAITEIGSKMIFEDDAPGLTLATTQPGPDVLVVDESNLALDFTANYSAGFSPSPIPGSDGVDTVASVFTLTVLNPGGVDSGLVDVATNNPVFLFLSAGGVVEGREGTSAADAAGGDLVFTVTVNAGNADLTLDQKRALKHPDGTNANDAQTLSNVNLIQLTRKDTITDKDGDSYQTSASIDIAKTLTFKDDGPTLAASTNQPVLVVDDSTLGANATLSFASVFTPTYGADGAGAVGGYTLGVVPGASGIIDVESNQAVNLSLNGSVVEGKTAGSGLLVFTLSVAANGNVTLDQIRAVKHDDPADPDEPGASAATLTADNLVTLTATVTDKDGDTNTALANIGQNLQFKDDFPTLAASTNQPVLVVDDSTLGANAALSFASVFTPTYGADGAGAVDGYTLGVVAGASGIVDVESNQAVNLSLNGTVVEGKTAGSGLLVFTVSVAANGNVTLDQIRAVKHDDALDPDEPGASAATLSADNLVTLTATVTDKDGDTNTALANIGQNLQFKDDFPTLAASTNQPVLVVDDSTLGANATLSFASVFTPTYGADGAGAVGGYTLGVVPGASGIIDVESNQAVNLSLNGTVVEGKTAGSGLLVFTVSVAANGNVTLDQIRAVRHDDALDPDEPGASAATLTADNLVTLTATVTDKDGDTNTALANIGQNLQFKDDGPSTSANAAVQLDDDALTGGNADGTGDDANATNATGTLGKAFGADGAGTVAYLTTGFQAGFTYEAGAGGSLLIKQSGTTVLTLAVNAATGAYTVTQNAPIQHAAGDNENNTAFTVNYRVTDKDGDTADGTLALDVDDDTPTVATSPVKDTTPNLGATLWTYSDAFAYSIGADTHGPVYAATDSDFANLSLSGFVNDAAIGSPSVTWVSESDSLATFNVSFNYDHDRNGTATQPVTGQLVFDKSADTYALSIDALQVKVDVTLGQGTGYQTYNINGTTPSSGPSPVATGKLGDGFYIQITGFESPLNAGGNATFTNGELVTGTVAPVTLSSTALGVSGNTIQSGEAAKLGFFTSDPKGNLGAPDFAYATDFFIKFDGIETESDDLILVLDLVNASNPAITTTRAIYVDQGDVYENDTVNTNLVGTRYEALILNDPVDPNDPFLDNNDGLLIVESNDYNVNVGDNWILKGLQILSNDAGLTGSAINLNRAVGSGGGSSYSVVPVSGLIGPGNTVQEDTSTNPLKIIDAGFSTTTTTPPTLDLELFFKLVDADGDYTAEQKIDIEYGVPAPLIELVGISSLEALVLP